MKGFITPFVALPMRQASLSFSENCTRTDSTRRFSLQIFFLFCFFGLAQFASGQIIKSRLNTPIINAAPPGGNCDGLFTITTVRTYDPVTNKTTLTYTVTNIGAMNALSHWGFPIDLCPGQEGTVEQILAGYVAQASDDGVTWHNVSSSYGQDGSQACITGTLFKFDEGMTAGSTKYYRLILNGSWSLIPAVAYVKYGNFCCTITLNNPGCLEEECIPPACNISSTPDNVCPGSTNTYSATPSGLDSYSWSITGNGTIVGSSTGQSVQVLAGTCGTFTLTLITRKNGCENTCSQLIHVTDITPPTIGTPVNATINCTATPNFTAPTANDNCGAATVNNLGDVTEGNSCSRTVTRRWDATDACGNHSATVSQTITIVDNVGPTIGAAGANATINCTATPSFTAPTASDACNGATVNNLGDITGGNSCTRTVTRRWDATDACGNHSATVSQTITLVDNVAPTIGAAGAPATINCTATPGFTPPTASDACNGATVNNLGDVTGGNSCTRTITRRWDATDACGNHSATVSQTITLIDDIAPTIGAAGAPATINCTATPGFTPPTANDACDGATVNNLGDVTGGNSCTRTVTRTWDATDACGNHSATVSQTITIIDNVAPTIGAAGANSTINCTATPGFTPPTANDACNGATVNNLGDVTEGNSCSRTVTRRWDATDACGNHSATVSQTITIVDNVGPTIGAAGANATINCTATPSFTAPTASDACNGATVNNLGDITGGNSCTRTVTRRWDATDACGNHSATVSQTITLVDNVAPTIGAAGAPATINCTATPGFTPPTASDACNGATVNNLGDVTGGNSCTRTITRRWDATDACGNHSATVSQTITLIDDIAPTIGAAGAPATINCTATPGFTPPTANDACDGATVNNLGDVTGGNSCTRTVTRTWDATDACGNHSATVSQTITIIDNVAPTIGAAGANATINCTATPGFTPPTANDACNGATVNNLGDVTEGNSCSRTVTRRWDATDACSNHSATVSQTITIVDNVGPTIGAAGANATINCTATPSFTAPTASDACNGATVNNLGDVTGGNSCTRTLTRRWDATDACGNHSATVSQTITLVDDVAPTIGAAGAGATINCTATPGFTAPTASDACNGATVNNLGDVTGGNSCTRTVTRRWDATDACGNHSATVSQTITLIDDIAPTIGAAGAPATINCTATPGFTAPTASDACNGATVNNLGDITGGNSCTRTVTRRWDATDACGNQSATVSQTITVIDNVAPVIGAAGANATINCTATPGFTAPSASDACNGATVNNLGDVTGGNSCTRTVTRTWDATDACGNHSATVSQTITIVDNVGPTIGTAGANATINCTATPGFTAPTASDACNGATVNNLGDVTGGNSCTRTVTRRWDATDACGNHSATVSQTVTLVDDVAPTIGTAGANATVNCTATPSFTPPTASDACNGATVNNLGDITGGNSCTRTVTRRWDATDACGNHSATVSQTITLIDDVAPTIGTAGANGTINCTATPSFTAPTASDACNGATVNNLGDITGGNSCTRTVTRRWDATDACGNQSATVSQTITVIDNVAPVIGAAGANATINCTATPGFTAPSASDACNGATVNNLGDVTGGNSCTRTVTRRWDATDACGNHGATVSQTITLIDDVAPTIGTAGANGTINCTATPSFTAPTASDACNGATVNNLGDVTGGNSCTKTITRRWNATDACGNHGATVSQTVTVVDNIPPTIGSPGADATIACLATPTFTAPTAADACNAVSVVLVSDVTVQGACAGAYTETRTWRAVDVCGNTSGTVAQAVTVLCCNACTYTQGAYGTPGGTACLPDGSTVNQVQIMINALDNEPGDFKVFGRLDLNRYWVIRLSDATSGNIFKMLPGGGPGKVLGLDTYAGVPEYSNHPSWPVAPLQANGPTMGTIKNILLAQTITLYFNTTISGNHLSDFALGDTLVVADADCGSSVPIPGTNDTVGLPHSVVVYLADPGHGYPNTIEGLLQLANDMLGGVNTGLSLTDVAKAIDQINNAFDGCRILLGYIPFGSAGRMLVNTGATTTQTSTAYAVKGRAENPASGQKVLVSPYPNPFNDNVRFLIKSDISGQGTLEVYDLSGAKLQVIYSGYIYSGKGQVIEYKVPALYRTNMMYVLRIGDKVVTGKLLNIR